MIDLDKIKASWHELEMSAKQLNLTSDALNEQVGIVSDLIRDLKLGLDFWVGGEGNFQLGYAKVGRVWGLAIRRSDTREEWLFKDAPRQLRIGLVGLLPLLIESLNDATRSLTQDVNAAAGRVQTVANWLKQ